jgi:hypothetical protein
MRVDVDITRRGPLFDGRAVRAVREFVYDAEAEVAARLGRRLIQDELKRVVRHETPYYRTKIAVARRRGHFVIHDSNIVYGPWLEGIGSRNHPVTTFHGYKTFERMTPRIQAGAAPVAGELLRRRFLRRMN